MKPLYLSLVYLLTLLCVAKSARILIVFNFPARSHYFLGSTLAKGLAERGHDVTMVSSFGEKEPPKNVKNGTYTDVVLTGLYDKMTKMMAEELNMFERVESNPLIRMVFVLSMMTHQMEDSLRHENFQKLLESKEKFDVVIVEQFMNDGLKVLANYFDAPLIMFSAIGPNFWVNPLVGNPSPRSYIPDFFLEYSSNMTFCERVVNSLAYILNSLVYHFYFFPKQNELAKKYIPNAADIDDVLYNASLVLLNSHPSLHQPVPLVPSMIDIGGFHVKPPKKLPQDLQTFLDGAEEGVIYFSMGSNLKSALLPTEKREALLKTFAKLKEKVLWKWEEDVLPGQPPNVKLGKWFPQQDILAHPNVKLFITHGGLLSTTETVYHGVPILAIPIFGDQKMNAKRAANAGYGLTVPFDQLTEELLTKSIKELLINPKYRENAKRRSRLFHDRQVSPLDTAIYWVEYVIRHKGAPHLRVAALDLPWYKYHLLDVIAFIAACFLFSAVISCLLIKYIYRRLFVKQKSKKVKKN